MKAIYSFFLLNMFFIGVSFAQTASEFIFSDIVKLDSIESGILIKNAKKWMEENGFQQIDTTLSNTIKAENSFFVYQKGLVSKQVHGKVHFKILLEAKNSKYRYTYYGFVFHYYKQTRNYEMKPTGKEKPLNDSIANGWQKTWNQHKLFSRKQIQLLAQSLKASLSRDIQHQVVKESISTDF